MAVKKIGLRMDDDSDAGDVASANERDAAEVEKAAKGSEEDDDDEEEEESEEASAEEEEGVEIEAEPERTPRQRRRQERATLRSTAEELRQENQRLALQLAELNGRQRTWETMLSQPRGEQQDPYQAELGRVSTEQELLSRQFDELSQTEQLGERGRQLKQQYRDKEDERHAIIARREHQRNSAGTATSQSVVLQQLQLQHPDMFEADPNPRVNRFTALQAEIAALKALGHQDSWQTVNLAAHNVRNRLGIRAAGRPPSDRERRKYTGSAVGGGPGVGGGSKGTVRVTDRGDAKAIRQIASAFGKHLGDDEKALKHWSKSVGSTLVKDGVLK